MWGRWLGFRRGRSRQFSTPIYRPARTEAPLIQPYTDQLEPKQQFSHWAHYPISVTHYPPTTLPPHYPPKLNHYPLHSFAQFHYFTPTPLNWLNPNSPLPPYYYPSDSSSLPMERGFAPLPQCASRTGPPLPIFQNSKISISPNFSYLFSTTPTLNTTPYYP